MNPSTAECPECKGLIEYTDEIAGQVVTCPHCAIEVTLPAAQVVRKIPIKKWAMGIISILFLGWLIYFCSGYKTEGGNTISSVLGVLLFAIPFIAALALYFLPWLIARGRHHRNRIAILMINIFLGWTILGWVGALVWAIYREKDQATQ